jgi:hypothetical protein
LVVGVKEITDLALENVVAGECIYKWVMKFALGDAVIFMFPLIAMERRVHLSKFLRISL